ncbi:nitroreductase family protein [Acuticoccus sp. I52.16.1]|uniref:nitroreductase family protein n=1 Tax=Acuticoccus sp. I52.16.1 TaxID=2928472 RepID=UPI001FD47E78|nr:nitroreductase family protein [Acuticoccus sp. I52.16.1]UOM37187.1 nitroreductase family protein [Acuticoccus sp. I52.16.1]
MPRLPRGGGGAPAILRRAVRPVRAGWDEARRALLARVRPGSPAGRLLYRLLCEDFTREQQAVLAGIRRYRDEVRTEARNQALLRRRIHMLEKGLAMRPRRAVFALDYIAETVDAYALRHAHVAAEARRRGDETAPVPPAAGRAGGEAGSEGPPASRAPASHMPAPATRAAPPHRAATGGGRAGGEAAGVDDTLIWAHDVLARTFAACAPHPVFAQQEVRFAALPPPPRGAGPHEGTPAAADHSTAGRTRDAAAPRIPYARDLAEPPPVAYADLLALARRRRSVRWFRPEPVPRALFERALAVAAQSPSACNRQPFVFRVFDDAAMVRAVADTAMGTRGYAHNVPMIAVLVGQQRHFFDARDRHLVYIDGALAAMALVLALETLGLASCLVNWPDIEAREAALAALIGLEADERPVMLIAIGHPDPDGLVPFSAKKAPGDLLRYG